MNKNINLYIFNIDQLKINMNIYIIHDFIIFEMRIQTKYQYMFQSFRTELIKEVTIDR